MSIQLSCWGGSGLFGQEGSERELSGWGKLGETGGGEGHQAKLAGWFWLAGAGQLGFELVVLPDGSTVVVAMCAPGCSKSGVLMAAWTNFHCNGTCSQCWYAWELRRWKD